MTGRQRKVRPRYRRADFYPEPTCEKIADAATGSGAEACRAKATAAYRMAGKRGEVAERTPPGPKRVKRAHEATEVLVAAGVWEHAARLADTLDADDLAVSKASAEGLRPETLRVTWLRFRDAAGSNPGQFAWHLAVRLGLTKEEAPS